MKVRETLQQKDRCVRITLDEITWNARISLTRFYEKCHKVELTSFEYQAALSIENKEVYLNNFNTILRMRANSEGLNSLYN